LTASFLDLAAEVKDRAAITAEDTLAMRRVVWPDGKIDPAEADAIFDVNTSVKGSTPEWVDFFAEAISTFLVRQQTPVGYVDDAKASWLMARIDADGRVDSLGELTLLVKILEDATNVPETLKTYALKQIEQVVLTGTGPTRDGGSLIQARSMRPRSSCCAGCCSPRQATAQGRSAAPRPRCCSGSRMPRWAATTPLNGRPCSSRRSAIT